MPLDTRYIALSYVWGDIRMPQLQSDNFERLSSEGSLEAIRPDLPKTINDAIDLLRALGERYLWVDGLCLVQDSADDMTTGIRMMNSIYHGSYFTIVAGSGTDAIAGLPGVAPNARGSDPSQAVKEIRPGLAMTTLYSIDYHLRRSVYNTRGWTLQELILPRRAVIFIDGQAHFRCQEANWCEETWSDRWPRWLDPDDSNVARIPDPGEGFLPALWAYQKLAEDYSRRKLRRDGDAIRALAGITRPLAFGMRALVAEGLPGSYLDHFLLFISATGRMRQRTAFASFSWAG